MTSTTYNNRKRDRKREKERVDVSGTFILTHKKDGGGKRGEKE
jgi:hypothetical protein